MNAPYESLQVERDHNVLRFITAGSVDDGKSTLIGRLLYDSKGVYADQLQAVAASRYRRGPADDLNLALLTDGLEAEREQGITIDVAYRYFTTPRRKFIVADAPGHEQYTRNMVTGASTAHAAVILIDATKVRDGQLLVQTRRHSTIARLLGVRHIILAVNKLDLLDWDPAVFSRITQSYAELAGRLGIAQFRAIPVSALLGDNVVHSSGNTPWYQGPTLLEHLESLEAGVSQEHGPLRFSVQWVMRHNGHQADDLRAYAGQVVSGALRVGESIVVQPSGVQATIQQLLNHDGPVPEARAGSPVTVVLSENVDVSRGDWFSHAMDAPLVGNAFEADLAWLDARPLSTQRRYLVKHGARISSARVRQVHTRRDLQKLEELPAGEAVLAMNDIGRVSIQVRDALAVDSYTRLPATGAFILIDEATHQTVAGGMIRGEAR
ncbi:sulfate adenylyltransferase subunit 1 [Paracandidimonas soli]|uniref:sulfate adenylyltransferase subunit 1 n=1 Tax=Paracandidimonas soli TaxID=1917182 RepID=UPI0033424837